MLHQDQQLELETKVIRRYPKISQSWRTRALVDAFNQEKAQVVFFVIVKSSATFA